LIFGVLATTAVQTGTAEFGPPFMLLLAISLVSVVIAPLAVAAALRFQMQ
jgi:heme exporter protein B